MKVVILCGGKGTRFQELTQYLPKPLVDIGGRPILWHVMKIYAHQGFNDFVLCLGYKGDMIKEYFLRQKDSGESNLQISVNSPNKAKSSHSSADWRVTLVDTGVDTNTGGRIKKIENYVDGDVFFANYADGLARVDLKALLKFHKKHRKTVTLLGVKPLLRFGILSLDSSDLVTKFVEKPQLDIWINGGFFVFTKDIFRCLDENSILERSAFETLASKGEIVAYKHTGFWQCMDTYKDCLILNDLWKSNKVHWKVWE